jgi:hypothetical protein
MAADAAIDPKISEPAGGRVFARALKNATSDLKGIGGLVLTLTAAIAGYFALRDVLKAPGYWPEAAVAAFFIAFYFLYVHPAWRDERKRQRLNDEGVRNQLEDPTYFRLSPYEADDKERFTRPDGAVKSAHKWIVDSNIPLLYLSGQSGVGKSSLLNAAIVPALANQAFIEASKLDPGTSGRRISTATPRIAGLFRLRSTYPESRRPGSMPFGRLPLNDAMIRPNMLRTIGRTLSGMSSISAASCKTLSSKPGSSLTSPRSGRSRSIASGKRPGSRGWSREAVSSRWPAQVRADQCRLDLDPNTTANLKLAA